MAKAAAEVTETALVPAGATGETVNYPALVGDAPTVMAKIERNLGGRAMTASDLPRIKVPTGGGTTWDLGDDDDEDGGAAKKLPGVIIHSRSIRACWDAEFTGGNNPPDCHSNDGRRGSDGTPCATCPNAQFGSKGNGQKCKQMQQLFILLPGYFLPMILNVPPTSLKNYSNYAIKVGSKGFDMFEVVTELSLEKDKSNDGIEYSKVRFKKAGELDSTMATVARALGQSVAGAAGGPSAKDFQEEMPY